MAAGEMAARPLVAIVDDDRSIRVATRNLLQAAGFATATFGDPRRFLRSPRARRAACLLADMRMPAMTGLQMYLELVAAGERIPTVLITAYPEDFVRARAREAGIVCCLSKPFAPDELLDCVREALGRGDAIPRS
jgi:FixJ family two-component response regulator